MGAHLLSTRVRSSLFLRNLTFTLVIPGAGAVWAPWWILTHDGEYSRPEAWYAVFVMAAGAALYGCCLRAFVVVGRGTPGPWDAPRHFVAVGPYRWVRNPIYIGALLVVLGEAWLFHSYALLVYAGAMAFGFHLFIVIYEEPRLESKFGETYREYRREVWRWLPRLPRKALAAAALSSR